MKNSISLIEFVNKFKENLTTKDKAVISDSIPDVIEETLFNPTYTVNTTERFNSLLEEPFKGNEGIEYIKSLLTNSKSNKTIVMFKQDYDLYHSIISDSVRSDETVKVELSKIPLEYIIYRIVYTRLLLTGAAHGYTVLPVSMLTNIAKNEIDPERAKLYYVVDGILKDPYTGLCVQTRRLFNLVKYIGVIKNTVVKDQLIELERSMLSDKSIGLSIMDYFKETSIFNFNAVSVSSILNKELPPDTQSRVDLLLNFKILMFLRDRI